MPTLENDVFLRALRREPTPYTPVWLMRQAGRYLPEYNATRAKAGSFLALAKTPSLATEVTLQPLARFPLDAAILFSDILTVPDAMGLGLLFRRRRRPAVRAHRRRRARDRARSKCRTWRACAMCSTRSREIKRALAGRVPLIGFAGSPFTLACYMIEGAGSPDFAAVRRMAHEPAGSAAAPGRGECARGDRVQGALGGQAFNRGDLLADGFADQYAAGARRDAVDVNGAGAALCNAASVFGAGESDVFPDRPKQRRVVFNVDSNRFAIDSEVCHRGPLDTFNPSVELRGNLWTEI